MLEFWEPVSENLEHPLYTAVFFLSFTFTYSLMFSFRVLKDTYVQINLYIYEYIGTYRAIA